MIGCLPQAGATTIALAIATSVGDARVVECCPATASGLIAASTAELGTSASGWALGRRDRVGIARTTGVHLAIDELPAPGVPAARTDLTVLDVGWDLGQVLRTPGWVRDQVTGAGDVVVVTTATVPGLRRLETALMLLDRASALVAVRGPDRRRWPGWLAAALGPGARAAQRTGRLLVVPHDKHLALAGIEPAPLPASLLRAAEDLRRRTGAGSDREKGLS